MKAKKVHFGIRPGRQLAESGGFGLIETLMSLIIMSFGMLAVGQLLFLALGGPALARAKSTATVAAQDKLEFLADAYRQNADAPDLTLGAHGPEVVEVRNPIEGNLLNRYNVSWIVNPVPDPRPWKVIHARCVTVTVTPVGTDGVRNDRAPWNKVVNMTSIFSARPD